MKTSMNTMKNYEVLLVCFLITLFNIFLELTPSRGSLLNYCNGSGNCVLIAELLFSSIIYLVYALLFGCLTDLILQNVFTQESRLISSVRRAKIWFPRSLTILLIGYGGIKIIKLTLLEISSDFVFSLLTFFIGSFWVFITFTLYPTVIKSQKPLVEALIDAFSTNIKSLKEWLPVFLCLFIISGGLTFLWIPEFLANHFWGANEDYSGWMFHFQWLGGYSFHSYWYSDLTKWLFLKPPFILNYIILLINTLMATALKIKVTKILFDNGYLNDEIKQDIYDTGILQTAGPKHLNESIFEPSFNPSSNKKRISVQKSGSVKSFRQ